MPGHRYVALPISLAPFSPANVCHDPIIFQSGRTVGDEGLLSAMTLGKHTIPKEQCVNNSDVHVSRYLMQAMGLRTDGARYSRNGVAGEIRLRRLTIVVRQLGMED